MKENYIVPLMTVFTVSPVKALMTSAQTGNSIPDYDLLNPGGLSWDTE